jgi:hypothetical protein
MSGLGDQDSNLVDPMFDLLSEPKCDMEGAATFAVTSLSTRVVLDLNLNFANGKLPEFPAVWNEGLVVCSFQARPSATRQIMSSGLIHLRSEL